MIEAKQPTENDLRGIAEAVAEEPLDVEEVQRVLKGAAIAKFTDYISDGPGYRGDVFVVVWPGGPEIIDVLTRKKSGELVANTTEETSLISDVWGEDREYPRSDWRYEVNNGNTNLGYWDWVRGQRATKSNG